MSNRTKQMQFRMPEELHTNLKAALVHDKISLADFFNRAAEEYLSARYADEKGKLKSRDGGTHNG